jgi:IS30 family transposase
MCKLATRPALRAMVGEKLKQEWSPQQIAGWLKATHPNDPEMQVSHEDLPHPVQSSPGARYARS